MEFSEIAVNHFSFRVMSMFGLVLSFWSQFMFCLFWIVRYLFILLSYPVSVREHNARELFHCSREIAPGSALRPCLSEWDGEKWRLQHAPSHTPAHKCLPHVTAHTHIRHPTHMPVRGRDKSDHLHFPSTLIWMCCDLGYCGSGAVWPHAAWRV